jgi:hypothetical protein
MQRKELRMKRTAFCASIAAAAALAAGCGGSGSGTTTATSTTAVGASAAAPRPAYKCLTGAGLPVKVTAPTEASTIAALLVNVGTPHQVNVGFMKTKAAAEKFATAAGEFLGAAGGKARAKVVGGTVVLGIGPKAAADELNRIKSCVTR